MTSLCLPGWRLLLTTFLPVVMAGTKYLDDSDPSAWAFIGSWNAVSSSTPCTICVAEGSNKEKVQFSKAYNETYHDGAVPGAKGGTITFKGNAIQVYGLQVNFGGAVNFSLPGTSVVRYESPESSLLNYNFKMFEATGLKEDTHILTFSLDGTTNGGTATLLDYAIVEFADTTSSSTSSSASRTASGSESQPSHSKAPVGAIVGGVLGGIVVLLIVAIVLFKIRRRRRDSWVPAMNDLEPYAQGSEAPGPPARPAFEPENSLSSSVFRKQKSLIGDSHSVSQSSSGRSEPAMEERLRQLESEMRQVRSAGNLPPAY
ncbi:hypothetical protein DL96DRAFT_1816764 [Flagelloscypha sp. PMI_526]|nr:hypothetical protein DL96DRAFT_1816764 [Flagelloscypha sp. PMI_526]